MGHILIRQRVSICSFVMKSMRKAYPIVISKENGDFYYVEIPDFDIVALVDVDFAEYRKKVDNKAVKRNCTIPYWLSVEAEKVGVNY